MRGSESNKTISARLHDDFWVGYQTRTNLISFIEENERYINGDQWPDNNVYNEVRITFNYLADTVRKMAARIMNSPFDFVFTANDDKIDCNALKRYDKYVLSKIGHEAFSHQCAVNGYNLGTEIVYMRVDGDAPYLYQANFAVGIEEIHISPKCFAVANPKLHGTQRQEWLMFWSDVYIGALVNILKHEKFSDEEYKRRLRDLMAEGSSATRKPDDENPDKDLMNRTPIRVYTRFFRIKGEVCYTQETETVSLFRYPRPLSTLVSEAFAKKVQEEFDRLKDSDYEKDDDDFYARDFSMVPDLDIDLEDTIAELDQRYERNNNGKSREKFYLYPFEDYVPKVINGSFYGRSISKEMRRAQDGINRVSSDLLKAVDNIAFDKTYVRDGAMRKNEVFHTGPETNLVHDHYTGNANGFYKLQTASVPADLFKVIDYFATNLKSAYGVTDMMNGEMPNPETSGYALELATTINSMPIEQEKMLFWDFQVRLARIRLMFYKHYVNSVAYTYEMNDVEYNEEESSRKWLLSTAVSNIRNADKAGFQRTPIYMQDGSEIPDLDVVKRYKDPSKRKMVLKFNGADLRNVDFDIEIKAQKGLIESALSSQQWYTSMFANGGIQAYADNPDLLLFAIKSAPQGVIPEDMRAAMLYWAKDAKNSLLSQYKQALQQKDAQLEQFRQLLEQGAKYNKAKEAEDKEYQAAMKQRYETSQKELEAAQKALQELQGGQQKSSMKGNLFDAGTIL